VAILIAGQAALSPGDSLKLVSVLVAKSTGEN
jgi:hypothetical protein